MPALLVFGWSFLLASCAALKDMTNDDVLYDVQLISPQRYSRVSRRKFSSDAGEGEGGW